MKFGKSSKLLEMTADRPEFRTFADERRRQDISHRRRLGAPSLFHHTLLEKGLKPNRCVVGASC